MRGVWLYLYPVIDVWSRKVVDWEVAEREEARIAADLVSKACLKADQQRRHQLLIVYAENGPLCQER